MGLPCHREEMANSKDNSSALKVIFTVILLTNACVVNDAILVHLRISSTGHCTVLLKKEVRYSTVPG